MMKDSSPEYHQVEEEEDQNTNGQKKAQKNTGTQSKKTGNLQTPIIKRTGSDMTQKTRSRKNS